MYSQQFTLCYVLVKSPLLRIRFYNFLRHQSVSGAPPPKKSPGSAPTPRETSPAGKSEEKRLFSQANSYAEARKLNAGDFWETALSGRHVKFCKQNTAMLIVLREN